MSYDLSVYGRDLLARAELAALVEAVGLRHDPDAPGAGLTVVRGGRSAYCFTLEPPSRIEPDDVPDVVVSAVLAPSVLYSVLVEGSHPQAVPHAVRFARRLAEASLGAVVDEQTDEVWSRSGLRRIDPAPAGRIDLVKLEWYVVKSEVADDFAAVWLEMARRFLPEALPRRFGSYEPFAGRLDRDGDGAFAAALAEETSSLFIVGTAPCHDGGLQPRDLSARFPVGRHSLSVQRRALDDPGWRDGVRRFFIEVAERSGAFYASGRVTRDHLIERGRIWSDGETERTSGLAGRYGWMGLDGIAPWWAWFGTAYAPMVRVLLPTARVARSGALFSETSAGPIDDDAARALPWVPERMRIRGGQHDECEPAIDIPAALLPVTSPTQDEIARTRAMEHETERRQAAGLITDLRALGFAVPDGHLSTLSLPDARARRRAYPILVDHLERDELGDGNVSMIACRLLSAAARPYWHRIAAVFATRPPGNARERLAATLAVAAGPEEMLELGDLFTQNRSDRSAACFVRPLLRFDRPRWEPVLRQLVQDPILGPAIRRDLER